MYREPGNSSIKLTLYQLFTADSLSASLVSGTVGGKARFERFLIEQKRSSFSTSRPAGIACKVGRGWLALRASLHPAFTWHAALAAFNCLQWKRQNADALEGEPEESIVAVDIAFLMSSLDETQGTPFAEQMDA